MYYLKKIKYFPPAFIYDSSCLSVLDSLVSLDVLKITLSCCYQLRWGREWTWSISVFQIICLKASCFINDTFLFLHISFSWLFLNLTDLEIDFNSYLNSLIIFTFLLYTYILWTQSMFCKHFYFQSLFLWPFLPGFPDTNPLGFYVAICVFCSVIF